jgi:hypothetical protein
MSDTQVVPPSTDGRPASRPVDGPSARDLATNALILGVGGLA